MKTRTLFAWVMMGAALQASALDFTYNYYGADPKGYPVSGKAETIDVAILLDNPVLEGKTVTGMSVPLLGDVSLLSDFSAFMTTELKTKNKSGSKVNSPDVCSVAASVSDGVLSVTFPEPYVITEKGVYVGYSLTVPKNTVSPIAVVPGGVNGGLEYHATASQMTWKDMAATQDMASAMTVFVDGSFPVNAAGCGITERGYLCAGEPGEIMATVYNYGTAPLSSVEYTYSVGGQSGKGECLFENPVPAVFGIGREIAVPVGAIDVIADYDVAIEIVKVNGVDNECPAPGSAGAATVMPFVPKCRPLAEEYTGLDCGYCPRGYIALKEMNEKYSHDEFVAIAYHSGYESGKMVCLEEYPYYPSGYPAAQMDRSQNVDPGQISEYWERLRKKMPVAEIDLDFSFDDEQHTSLTARSTVRFVKDFADAGFRVAYVMVADGLSDPMWIQYNAYSFSDERSEDQTGPWWDLFIGTDRYVPGLVFDDIAVYSSEINGIPGSLPEVIAMGEPYEGSFTVKTDDVVNVDGEHIVKDFGHTRMIGIVLDKDGKVVASASSPYPVDEASVDVLPSARVMSVEWFDLQGRRMSSPGRGLNIRVETLEDGSTRSAKIML